MNARPAVWLLIACSLCGGCALPPQGREAQDPCGCRASNDWFIDKIFDTQADQAWSRIRSASPVTAVSEDYAAGFKQGYIASLKRYNPESVVPPPPKSEAPAQAAAPVVQATPVSRSTPAVLGTPAPGAAGMPPPPTAALAVLPDMPLPEPKTTGGATDVPKSGTDRQLIIQSLIPGLEFELRSGPVWWLPR